MNHKGMTLIELTIAAMVAILLLLWVSKIQVSFTQQQVYTEGFLESKREALRALEFISHTARYASECTSSDPLLDQTLRNLTCTIDFGSGPEQVHFTFSESTKTITYKREKFAVTLLSGVENFTFCSGDMINNADCFDSGSGWGDSATLLSGAEFKNYYRIRITKLLTFEKNGALVDQGRTATYQTGFTLLNADKSAPVFFSWAPLEGV